MSPSQFTLSWPCCQAKPHFAPAPPDEAVHTRRERCPALKHSCGPQPLGASAKAPLGGSTRAATRLRWWALSMGCPTTARASPPAAQGAGRAGHRGTKWGRRARAPQWCRAHRCWAGHPCLAATAATAEMAVAPAFAPSGLSWRQRRPAPAAAGGQEQSKVRKGRQEIAKSGGVGNVELQQLRSGRGRNVRITKHKFCFTSTQVVLPPSVP